MTTKPDANNPYVGPRPFERNEEDSSRFFGRSRETQEVVSLIFGHPLLLVYAQSGAGKTSLFNTSITTTLEEEGFDVLPLTRVREIIPDAVALGEVENIYVFNSLLNMASDMDPKDFVKQSLVVFLKKRPRAEDENGQPTPRVLIFDQFEELFTFTPQDFLEQREAFFLQVTEALETDPLLRIVFLIREDFLAQLDPYARLLPERMRTRYRLERLQADAAMKAINAPLSGTNRSFAPQVAENLVKELLLTRTVDSTGSVAEVEGQYVEPVQLQVVCHTLWSNLQPDVTVISHEHLEGFDVNKALSNFYQTAIQTVVQEIEIEELVIREWFGQTLITPMETRNTVYRGEKMTGGIPNTVVDALESQHLIRAEYRAGVRWYELTHDRFIEAILADNEEWYAKRRETFNNPVTASARDWERLERDDGSLLRGALLEEANAWTQTHPNELDDLEQAFLKASQLRYQQELESNARTARTFRNLTWGLILVVIIAIGAAINAFQQSNVANSAAATSQAAASIASTAEVNANNARNDAETEEIKAGLAAIAALDSEKEARSGQLALQAITNLDDDPQLSLLLAIEAVREKHTFDADDALRRALEASRARAVLGNHTGRLNALAFSSKGEFLATGGADGTVRVWNPITGEQLALLDDHDKPISSLAFSQDDLFLATVSSDGLFNIWEVEPAIGTDGEVRPKTEFSAKGGDISVMEFSHDGRFLVTAGIDGTARLWEVDFSGESSVEAPKEPLITLKGHTDVVNAVAISLSPDGDRIATASLDGTAILWNAETGDELVLLEGHTSSINTLTFREDGRLLATASADSIRLWSAITGAELPVLKGHNKDVLSVAFSPDGRYLASGSADNTARLWNAVSGDEIRALSGHSESVNTVVFSEGGDLLATGSADGTIRIWSVPDGELQSVLEGHGSSVNVVAFNPDGDFLASASSDGTARIWDVVEDNIQRVLRGHEDRIWDVVFDPEGNWLASQGEDAAILWDFSKILNAEGGDAVQTVLKDFGTIGFGLEFSPDGKLLGLNRIFEGEEGDETGTFTLLEVSSFPDENIFDSYTLTENIVFNGSFNDNGNEISMIASKDDFRETSTPLLLWGFSDDSIIEKPFPGISLNGVAFNPSGDLLATSGDYIPRGAGVIQLWDVSALRSGDSNAQIAIIRTEELMVRIMFSPDGRTLISAGLDNTIRLWDVEKMRIEGGDDAEVAVLRGHENGVIGLAISVDGRLLASSDLDGIVRLWDVPKALETGGADAELSILRGHNGSVYAVAFSPNAHWLVSGGSDETLRLWTVDSDEITKQACLRVTRNLTQNEWVNYFGSTQKYSPTCKHLPYHKTVLDAMIEQGHQYVLDDRNEQAMEIWQEVIKLDPQRDLDPEEELVNALIEAGERSTKARDFEKALSFFERAVERDPTRDSDVAQVLIEIVSDQQSFAFSDQFKEMLPLLSFYIEIDPTQNPETAQVLIGIISNVRAFHSQDQIADALSALEFALSLDPESDRSALAYAYNQVCRLGSLDGFTHALSACERAIELAPGTKSYFDTIGNFRDSRGIARMIAGDLPGATEDFTYFVQWAKSHSVAEEIILQREEWVDMLKEGLNPLEEDPELIDEIRNQ